MMAQFIGPVLDCPDTLKLARFYADLTGGRLSDDSTAEWATIITGAGGTMYFQRADDFQPPQWPDPSRPQQCHLDFRVDDFEAEGAEATRLGAVHRDTRIQPDGSGFVVYIDPAGHPFCLCRTADAQFATG